MFWANQLSQSPFWSVATILLYFIARRLFQRWPFWWLSPLLVAPASLLVLALLSGEQYRDYIRGTRWLVALLGPAMVAFAIPIYEQRQLIHRHWSVLAVGVFAGSVIAVASAWALASMLGVSGALRLSLLPRSVSTPFAMTVSGDIGGLPELTAMFVILTGLVGASLGQVLLRWLSLRSTLARGALFGMGAHSVGVATANRISREEGSIAGLVMVLAGLFSVLAAPLLAYFLHHFT